MSGRNIFISIPFSLIATFATLVSHSQSRNPISATMVNGILVFNGHELDEIGVNELKNRFSKNDPLDESMLTVLFGKKVLENVNQWYDIDVDPYTSLEQFKIIPVELKEFIEFAVFVYKRSPDIGEAWDGDAISFRYLEGGKWTREINYGIGRDLGATPVGVNGTYEWDGEALHITNAYTHRSPGLLYYINQPSDVPLSSEEISKIEHIYSWNNGELSQSEPIKSDTVIFHPEAGFKDQLEKDGNGDIFITTILNDNNIDYEKKYNLVDGIVQLQIDLLAEKVVPNQSFLKIIGSNIWVRDSPSTGEIVMKLNDGDLCRIIQKGKYEEIREMKDYWYKIDFQGQTGWVYGSQSTAKLELEKL